MNLDNDAAEVRTVVEWATFHSDHRVDLLPDPFVNEAGTDERLADIRVERWSQTHPHGRHGKMRRVLRTTVGPWEPAADA